MRPLKLAAFGFLAAATTLSSCATTPQPVQRSAEAQRELTRWLDGRVAGKPQACLTSLRTQNMVVVDENTILFRDGSNRVWRNEVNGPCTGLGRPGNALVTRQFGSQMCRGEIAQVVDVTNGFTVGGCSLGDFVPYTGRGRS